MGVKTAAGLAAVVACCFALVAAAAAQALSLPTGFRDEIILSELPEPTALKFSLDGRIFIAEKTGRVVLFDDLEDTKPTLFADLRTQVYDAADRGLLGLAIDPKFPARPFVYLLYTYDHVLGEAGKAPKWGKPDDSGDVCPKPADADVDECPVSGRLVRLTVEEDGAGDQAVENGDGEVEEEVLVEDWCQQFSSHSIGDLHFDSSGALYASGGDGADFNNSDYGQFGWPQKNQCGDPDRPVGAELAPPGAEGGALRSQDASTLSDPTGLDGSLIRIDPDSGAGLPGNPMSSSLDANARRIVAYGFRNPFRFAIDPLHDEVYTANVGWNRYEEIDRFPTIPNPAFNSGWPCYEGPGPNSNYLGLGLTLCQSLYSGNGPSPVIPPFFFYRHGHNVIPGDGCGPDTGSAISGLAFYSGGTFPPAYDGSLFFADPVRGCIYVMFRGGDGRPDPLSTTTFMAQGGLYPGIDLEVGPDGALYYVKLFGDTEEGTIHRVSYDPDAPVARLTASPEWGPTPLEDVELDASSSSDPNGEPLSFEWDLDDNGTFETDGGEKRTQTFFGSDNDEVAVRVSDGVRSSVARVTLYPGDTPPQPVIAGPAGSMQWRVGEEIEFSGFADDEEEPGGEVADADLYWKTRLYHCPSACHAHPLQVFPGVDDGDFQAPDHDYPAHIEISLTATDSRGLSATEAVLIYPRTVDLTIVSDPAGIELGAGPRAGPAPFVLRAIEGSKVVLSAPPSAPFGGGEHPWRSWSDGGARVHSILARESATYTASYVDPAAAREPAPPLQSQPQPPRTRIVKRPLKLTRRTSASFVFASSRSGSRFRCRLDRGRYRACRSPRVFRHLRPGKHSFRVVAVDGEGNVDPTPAVFRWTVLPGWPY
ncbi:MAG TPA: PQQ-dependent sugar dehydrogenase [Solirubrobacterales bacterium]|nr:PQQ-dependent sugar dehydrogenase [Solirubrobacterales bacterium]